MSRFQFITDEQSEKFCMDIAKKMMELFGISEKEAIGRINRHWRGLTIKGPKDLIYHEDPEYWAKTIYYGADSMWWIKEGKEELKPLPYQEESESENRE